MVVRPEDRRPNRPGRALTWFAFGCALAVLSHATWRITSVGGEAFGLDWPRADVFLTSAWPALLLAPFFVLAFQQGMRVRYRRCGLLLAWGLLLYALVLLVPRGVYVAGWYLLPVLVLLVTCLFGGFAGVTHSVTVIAALVYAATLTDAAAGVSEVWTQVLFAAAAVVIMNLLGTTLQRTLDVAISAEEDQSARIDTAKRALRHRENLLRHAMRIDTVGAMSSMVVHQLRNQFQLILGYAAVGRQAADADTERHFRAIVETLGKSNDLLEGLLGLSRAEEEGQSPVDLTALCQQLSETYQRVLPARIRFEVELPDQPVVVHINAQGLEHALLNLVINARQAMSGDGVIRLRLQSDETSASLSVEDTGVGIPDDKLEEIFKPFYTTKKKGEGTGLGLAAVHRFVIASRGEVAVGSVEGEGTVFTLSFPLRGIDIGAALESAAG